jgi:hypothetical protein
VAISAKKGGGVEVAPSDNGCPNGRSGRGVQTGQSERGFYARVSGDRGKPPRSANHCMACGGLAADRRASDNCGFFPFLEIPENRFPHKENR